MAVGCDHKLSRDGRPVPGKVGHDRIQQAAGDHSIGAAIRHWYGITTGGDFERIEVEVEIHAEGHFILTATAAQMRERSRLLPLERPDKPLSFHQDFQSKRWREQVRSKREDSECDMASIAAQLRRVVKDHRDPEAKHILEPDLLRTAGALSVLGVDLGPYLGRGYDCAASHFQFANLPVYPCPVEIKKRSSGFTYQVTRYTHLPRVVVLCMDHDLINPPSHVDIIALPALADYLES
jgi:hypothetical protein